jgi:hypothetical protein
MQPGFRGAKHASDYDSPREQAMAAFKARRVLLLNDLESQFGL